MEYPDIRGAWRSKANRVYIITQVEDKFVWKVVHENGVVETGIGWFPGKSGTRKLEAQWNFHGGDIKRPVRSCKGEIAGKKKMQIRWEDKDDFIERIPRKRMRRAFTLGNGKRG